VRIISHGPYLALADVQARLDATPGSLRDLRRRVLLDVGVLPQPPGTIHRETWFALDGAPPTMNTNELRSHWKDAHAVKKEWQGRYAQALDALELPRPIRSVDDAGELAPVFAHVVVTTPGGKRADSPNLWITTKALGDAMTGRPHPERKIDHDHRTYTAGWLDQDNDRHLLTWLEVLGGRPRTEVRLAWDEPAPATA
jgi:hypothetical protein